MRPILAWIGACILVLSGTVGVAAQESYPVVFEAIQRAVLSAERAGSLNRLKVDVGDRVKKGNTIAKVDTSELALQKKSNQVALNYLETQISDLSRLIQRGLATNEEISKARMERDVTKTEQDIIVRKIINSSIRAPFSGIILKRHTQPHEWVTAGQPVVELVDTSKLRAMGNLPAAMAVSLEKGAEHSFYVSDLDISVTGKVEAVAPQVDERSNTAQVIWTVDKGEHKLLPGMKGEVRIGQ